MQHLRLPAAPAACITLALAIVVAAGSACRPAAADEGTDFFEKRIRPALVKHCYECHSAASQELKGGFRLDSRAGIRRGGDSGAAVVPGNADESLLIDAIRHESLEMPPGKKLPQATIADFQRWIKMGAPDPRDHPPSAREAADLSWRVVFESRRDWWSLKPVREVKVPPVRDGSWSSHPIDAFVLARLEAAGLAPAPAAAPRTLIRRLSLVLTGLPPTPAEVDEFVARASAVSPDARAAARESIVADAVTRLLNSPHFGERWARHWMDVVRFTETHGNEWNYEVHHAWRYRDYLIRAFNADVPFDRLVREHIAGDLLPEPRWNESERFNESAIGTAFFRFGEVNHDDCIGLRTIGYDILDNQIDTLGKAFQGLTIACARCHDHKFDAISSKDYYALLGILRSSRLVAHTIDAADVNAAAMQELRELKTKIRDHLAAAWLEQSRQVAAYLLAADAAHRNRPDAGQLATGLDAARLAKWVETLKVEKSPLEHPLAPWLAIASAGDGSFSQKWQTLVQKYEAKSRERETFNREQFVPFADFRKSTDSWQVVGHGLRSGASAGGELVLAAEGDGIVQSILPAGCYTHSLSARLNGALRSPPLPAGKKQISFRVMGRQAAAVRLVSNNCQLNYANYRALIDDEFSWITFPVPEHAGELRTYAELMTKFDNPKFPDQLATLGGAPQNDRVPWREAAADPRSYFGVSEVVLHDGPEPPQPELTHFGDLFGSAEAAAPTSAADVAARYGQAITAAIQRWQDDSATDGDVRWLDWLARQQLLNHSRSLTPQLQQLVADYRNTEQKLRQPQIVPGLGDFGDGMDQPLLERGDPLQPAQTVPRRYLEVLANMDAAPSIKGSGRLALAEQLASADNPLTARVIVNRVWHHLFGTGIVRTVDDFGQAGELPSHPELLDHLARKFVDSGWSIKELIRYIVLSRTFQQSSKAETPEAAADPQNRLLRAYPARRMEAEVIRDSILAASGRLDRRLYGMSIHPYRQEANADRRLFPGPLDGEGRRSIYIKANLMEGPAFLNAFNFPGGKVSLGRRDLTNVPTQALSLLNNPFVVQQAGVWAERVVEQKHASPAARIEGMFRTALVREPTEAEREEYERLVQRLAELHGVAENDRLGNRILWQDVAHIFFNLKEFIYIP